MGAYFADTGNASQDDAEAHHIRFKPFNCEHCLSIWLTVAYTIYNHYPYDEVIIFAGVNALIAVFVNKILNVLNNFIQ